MRFSITWQNEDCSGEPWTTEYSGHLQNIDEVNAYAVVLKNQLNMQHSGPRVRILTVQVLDEICSSCNHSLENNSHGFDQSDAHMDGDTLVHSGRCTYCKECNPRLKALLDEISNETTRQSDTRVSRCGGDYCQEC